MVYQGHMENGVVVFGNPVPLPDGTAVQVQAIGPSPGGFWESCSLAELAERQGVAVPDSP